MNRCELLRQQIAEGELQIADWTHTLRWLERTRSVRAREKAQALYEQVHSAEARLAPLRSELAQVPAPASAEHKIAS